MRRKRWGPIQVGQGNHEYYTTDKGERKSEVIDVVAITYKLRYINYMKREKPEERLFQIAASQGGYFTAFQAREAGYIEKNHTYHVISGNWIREWRGVYRLSRFHLAEDSQFSLWGVWSMSRQGVVQGVYSHETALSLFGLADVQPERLHMTFPRGHKRSGEVPNTLILHHANLDPLECEERMGYRVTNPFRTMADLLRSMTLSPEFIRQAFEEALRTGALTITQFQTLRDTPRIGVRLKMYMGEKG